MHRSEPITIAALMSRDVISVHPDSTLSEVAKIMAEHKFNGLPVVDESNLLVGIVTEYDLISGSGMSLHLPTLQAVLSQLPVFGKDKSEFKANIEEVTKLRVKDLMNKEPLTLTEDASYEEAVKTFQEHHRVNPIPIINMQRQVVGVLSRFDILKPLNQAFLK